MSARGVKRLAAPAEAMQHQREWFRSLRGPIVLADADVPHELFRALEIPYVVNQWWASICAAKQKAPLYLEALRARGYPDDVDAYSAIGLGSVLAEDDDPPWGGLPPVGLFATQRWSDAHEGIAGAWAAETDAATFAFEKAVDRRVPERWWERVADEWEDVIGSERLDLMEAEMHELVGLLEARFRRRFDVERLVPILELANEQQEWSRRTRDLLAATSPAPIDVVDSIPAVMIPQWHRGSVWARDAARRFHEEVEAAVERGDAVCPDERLRLMWIGRGLWFNLGFYQHFQERHGAVFVWSMYLAIAADGYPRRGGEPLRQLAARFAAFSDFLGMPGWADPWYVAEAKRHRVDGVVHLVAPESRSAWFATQALEDAGIPVLELDADNADARRWDEAAFVGALERFIEERLPRR
ncbi:MAG TPA: 2-hydroxyacyl-CoA dehydratase family protein [Gaiellaceae bacterium]|nr:2-hydroxyacyl-CoA dehydratase family protein [Gaiellaceae bacterium]